MAADETAAEVARVHSAWGAKDAKLGLKPRREPGAKLMADSVNVVRVENGWVLSVYCGGSTVVLIAKDQDEITGHFGNLEWTGGPRPLAGDATRTSASSPSGVGY